MFRVPGTGYWALGIDAITVEDKEKALKNRIKRDIYRRLRHREAAPELFPMLHKKYVRGLKNVAVKLHCLRMWPILGHLFYPPAFATLGLSRLQASEVAGQA
jgi:hypothetical protein